MHRAAPPRAVDQHLAPLADQQVPPGRRDPVLQLGALAEAFEGQFGRHLIGQIGRMGPHFGGEREEAGPIELGLGQELQEPVVVTLGLARVTEDEGGAEGGLIVEAADVGDAAQEALAVTPSAHAGQQRAGDVLEGEVEVRHPGGHHRLDELVGQPGRVQVEQPRAVDPGRDGAGQGGDGRPAGLDPLTRPRAVAAVGSQVLGHQHDLAQRRRGVTARRRSAGQERRHLGHDLVGAPRPLLAPEGRDGAEAADAVAPFGHLDVGPRGLRRRAGQLEQVEPLGGSWAGRGCRRGESAGVRGGRQGTGPGCGYGCERLAEVQAEAGHQVHFGQRLGQLVAVALGHAAGDHQAGPG